MPLYDKDTKLCDILFVEPSVLTVINKFGIRLGVGDASVSQICEARQIDTTFFLSIVNTFVNEDYFPENVLRSVDLRLIVDYLAKTDQYYEQFQLPNIERHFNSLVVHSREDNNNLSLLRRFFIQMKGELLANIRRDSEELFPLLLNISQSPSPLSGEVMSRIEELLSEEGHAIEDKVADLLSFFIIHLQGDYDTNLCRAVVSAIFTLEKDIKQNNRIRRRILRPLLKALISGGSQSDFE